ncbi:MAG: long-chain fatty acid--CoA ligase [Polyangiales bacterium]
MGADTIPARFLAQARERPDAPAYFVKVHGAWRATRWRDYVAEARRCARALLAEGVGEGEGVAMLGFNRPEWVIMDHAAMMIGAAPVGVYTTCSSEEVEYILRHAGCAVALVEDVAQWEKIRRQRDKLPSLRRVVLMRGAAPVDDPLVRAWEDFLASGDAVDEAQVDARVEALEPTGLATLIYTSGTTGPPKGVMLSHRNLAWTAGEARKLMDGSSRDVMLSYLPLSHIAEQMFTVHAAATLGYAVYFAESIERVPDNVREVQPTVFFGVPRIWEKFHAAVGARLKDATGAKAKLLAWARDVATRAHDLDDRGRPQPTALRLQHRLARRLVFDKLKPALGLGRARLCVSGAAPLGKDVLEFFHSIDTPVREVYGQSEDSGPTTFNFPGRTRLGTVGVRLDGVEVKLGDDGEILVRGPNVFMGYYRDEAATADALRDGWLHSGDLGAFDGEGFLTITGRKKDILITSGGKNIAPKNIEAAIKACDLVAEAVAVGDRRPYVTALITLDPEGLARFAKARGLDAASLAAEAHTRAEVRDEVQRHVDAVNATLARVETVKRFALLPRPFTLEDGELTPTLKVKRARVHANWSDVIEALYAQAEA